MAVVNEVAVAAPIPGIDISSYQPSLCRALVMKCRPSSAVSLGT
jgi:hypothetical protein